MLEVLDVNIGVGGAGGNRGNSTSLYFFILNGAAMDATMRRANHATTHPSRHRSI